MNHIDESVLELEDEGSAFSAEMAASSGFILDDTHVDDEDYSASASPNAPIAVPVKCHVVCIRNFIFEDSSQYVWR